MNKKTYNEIFNENKKNNEGVFIPFIVAGDPDYNTSIKITKTLIDNGADAIEIGFPFTDPVADGKSVQNADLRAFESGMNIKKSFEFIKEIRKYTDKPLGLLLYYNLIYKHGTDSFYKKLSEIGVNAVLIADLPPEESEEIIVAANKHNIEQIFIVAQTTNNSRLKHISEIAGGFIYIASIMGTTGARNTLTHDSTDLIKRVREHISMPLCVGFGISKPKQVTEVLNAGADGAITGSALINIIENNLKNKDKMINEIKTYVQDMKKATRG